MNTSPTSPRTSSGIRLLAGLWLAAALAACGGGGGGGGGGGDGGGDGGAALTRNLPNGGSLELPAGSFSGSAEDVDVQPHAVDLSPFGLDVLGEGASVNFAGDNQADFGIVSMPPPEGIDPVSVLLARVSDSGGITLLDTSLDDGLLTALTPGFSSFQAVQDNEGRRPEATIDGPTLVPTGTTVTYSEIDSPATGDRALPHEWVVIGEGADNRGLTRLPFTGNTAEVTFPAEGPFLVGVTVTDPDSGLSSFSSLRVSVQDALEAADTGNTPVVVFPPERPRAGTAQPYRALIFGELPAAAQEAPLTFRFSGSSAEAQEVEVGPGARQATASLTFFDDGRQTVEAEVVLPDGSVLSKTREVFLGPADIDFVISDVDGPDRIVPGQSRDELGLDALGAEITIEILEAPGVVDAVVSVNGVRLDLSGRQIEVSALPQQEVLTGVVLPGQNVLTVRLAADDATQSQSQLFTLPSLPLQLDVQSPGSGEALNVDDTVALNALLSGGNAALRPATDGGIPEGGAILPYRVEVDWGDGSPVEEVFVDATVERLLATAENGPANLASHRYDEAGDFTISVVATDFTGGRATQSVPVTVDTTEPDTPPEDGGTDAPVGDSAFAGVDFFVEFVDRDGSTATDRLFDSQFGEASDDNPRRFLGADQNPSNIGESLDVTLTPSGTMVERYELVLKGRFTRDGFDPWYEARITGGGNVAADDADLTTNAPPDDFPADECGSIDSFELFIGSERDAVEPVSVNGICVPPGPSVPDRPRGVRFEFGN